MLDKEAAVIGKPLNHTRYAMDGKYDPTVFDSAALATINNGKLKDVAPMKDDGLEDDERAAVLEKQRKAQGAQDTKVH
jgi:hypothetical protein